MRSRKRTLAGQLLVLASAILVVKVVASIVSRYPGYFPPDFSTDFLFRRETHFWGVYRWAFYTHILSGPVALVLGLFLVAEWPRRHWPAWHRWIGRLEVACVLLLVAPSGLWMARYAAAGPIAGLGLATLAVATAVCATMGWIEAVRWRFSPHRRWMWRCFLLLASAVVLRMIGGLATVTGMTATWIDPLATWACWVVPLLVFEVRERMF